MRYKKFNTIKRRGILIKKIEQVFKDSKRQISLTAGEDVVQFILNLYQIIADMEVGVLYEITLLQCRKDKASFNRSKFHFSYSWTK